MEKVNIYTIAKEAGVSVATVSRVFNRSSLVKKSTRERILTICKKYDYEPSKIASAITTKKTKSIALLVPSLKEPAFIELIDGVEYCLSQNGYTLSIFNARQSTEKQLEIARIVDRRFIDGVIFSGVYGNQEDKKFIIEMQKRKTPCIMVDRIIPNIDIPYVASDEYLGGVLAAEFILENNHTELGIVTYDTAVYIFDQRVKGFKNVLSKKGIKEKFVLTIPLKFGKIEKCLREHKDRILKSKPTAIFATSDSIAIFLINLLLQNNQRIVL